MVRQGLSEEVTYELRLESAEQRLRDGHLAGGRKQ